MSESNTSSPLQPSSELVRWLQSLALPIWARCLLVIVLFAVMLGGLAMVVWALIWQQREAMTAGVGLLTVALPISLVVMALVFGQRSEKRLQALTEQVLEQLIPLHLQQIVCTPCQLSLTLVARTGCRATYRLTPLQTGDQPQAVLQLSAELNVRKVNLMFALPEHMATQTASIHDIHMSAYSHVLEGAKAEGYQVNQQLARYGNSDGGLGLLLFKRLPEDFLLRPIEKLYFAQDLAFLVRGMAEAARIASAHPATP